MSSAVTSTMEVKLQTNLLLLLQGLKDSALQDIQKLCQL